MNPAYQLNTYRTLKVPFHSANFASTARRALQVDEELSPLVRRSFSLQSPSSSSSSEDAEGEKTVLQVVYSATTNRMLRVAVNGFFESLGVVLGVLEELDVDTFDQPGKESVQGAQGVEVSKDG
ncbi:hypothetical protein W97_03273 [Coniosporium apollinis CBS 100218]|uniref:Transcription factor Pcc1 n=1 Tax=Coniosporium apollinis (strain CBS 100218) TaxID=1168221 RepID=R7YQB2_CONA1|nr:uncharacterized protein W97_03273 [Coniosporium apollinis CBS 100218]EON64043.1 hypothetical protein W97_03273 [Coniosporium apollinis CBS 100218]